MARAAHTSRQWRSLSLEFANLIYFTVQVLRNYCILLCEPCGLFRHMAMLSGYSPLEPLSFLYVKVREAFL
jgi:hypothetical protein